MAKANYGDAPSMWYAFNGSYIYISYPSNGYIECISDAHKTWNKSVVMKKIEHLLNVGAEFIGYIDA